MNNAKTTRGALVSSVVALMLCFAMLIGTTFAWFTDSASSTGNVIKTGTLKVDFSYAEGTEAVDTANYKSAENVAVFNYDNIEPGFTIAKHFKISNTGSLDLKFVLSIVPNGEVSKLAEAIEVYYAIGGKQMTGRETDDLTHKGTLKDIINNGIAADNILHGEDYIVTIVLKLPESVGNEYQGLAIGDSFSMLLFATQLSSESDSFGTGYDDAADFLSKDANGNWLVRNASELTYLAYMVNSGAKSYKNETILLSDNIDLGGRQWIPIGNSSRGFEGTFDGQNYTISNYNVKGINHVGLFGYALNGGNIKNLKVKDANIYGNDYAAAILGRGYTDIVNCHAENVNVTVTPYLVSEGNYDGGAKAGAIVGQLLEGGSSLTGCTARNVKVVGYRDIGAVLGMAHSNNTVTDCKAYDSEVSFALLGAEFTYDKGKTPNENIGEVVGRINASATVTGSEWENVKTNSVYVYGLKLTRAYENDSYGTIYVSDKDSLFNIEKLNNDWDALFSDGKGTEYQNYTFNNYYYDWTWKIVLTSDIDFENATINPINLGHRLALDGQGYTIKNAKIATDPATENEAGLFVANKCGIKNLKVDNVQVIGSLVGNSTAGVISGSCNSGLDNVTITNSSVYGGKYTGGVVGYGYTNITNCTLENTTVYGGYKVGSLIGYICTETGAYRTVSGNTVKDVTVDGIGGGVYADGKDKYVVGTLVGHFNANGECKDNTVTGITTSATETIGLVQNGMTVNGEKYIADGLTEAGNEYRVYNANGLKWVADNVNAGNTMSGKTVMLMADIDLIDYDNWTTIGRNEDPGVSAPFSGTFDGNGHTVSNLKIYDGTKTVDSVGFIGYAQNATIKGLTIKNVNIYADYFVGAVVGRLISGTISDCHVTGNIKIEAGRNYAAGIVGDGYYNMENCSVVADGMGSITSKAVAGALCGRINEGNHFIENCTVKNVNVQSGQQVAAISGFVNYGNTITECVVDNVVLTMNTTTPTKPAIGLASGLWYYKANAPITINNNTFTNITISSTSEAKGKANILYGWEWNDNMTGVVESNNTLENVNNNLNYYVERVTVTDSAALLDTLANIQGETVIDATGVTFNAARLYTIPAGVTLKGAIIITDSYLVVGEGFGDTVVFEECEIKDSKYAFLNIVSDVGGPDMIFNDCTFRGKICPNFTSNQEGKAYFNDCTFLKGEGSGPDSIGFVACYDGTSTFTNCTFDYTDAWTMGGSAIKFSAINAYTDPSTGGPYYSDVILIGCTLINCGTKQDSGSTLTVK